MSGVNHVDIGFAETTESWKLSSHLFPSKVGGKPAWLSLKPIPSADDLKCSVCSHPCVFLLQLYAPLDDKTDSFHRTLFVFICRNSGCCKLCESENLVVLRSDLSRKNDFYSFDPPNYDSYDQEAIYPSARDHQPLCLVCGCAGTKNCSNCKAPYCCRSHQLVDWKRHKSLCKTDKSQAVPTEIPDVLFLEYGIVIEEDDDDEDDDEDGDGADNVDEDDNDDPNDIERRMNEFKEVAKNSEFSTQELEEMAFTETDKTFDIFKKVVKRNPDQIIRHNRGGEPLWITKDNQLSKSQVPACQYCGAERIFEFQVMPQLVAKLNMDNLQKSIDWGVLVVYTCSKSCSGSEANYRREFIYKQDVQPRKVKSSDRE